jgi:hypothetical protein
MTTTGNEKCIGAWTPVGNVVGGLTFEPALADTLDGYAGLQPLPRSATVIVTFRPSRLMVRLLFGWAATVGRTAVRSATRRRYLARRRRS